MIQIKEARTRREMKAFAKFPFSLYKGNPYWVPPILREELETFDPSENPVFQQAEARFFLAYREDRPVGRVAAIVNWTEVRELGYPKMRFGWMDFEDDLEISTALLGKVAEIGRSHGLQYMEGPMGFSNLDKVGVLTEGFDHIGSMITWYNYPYYADHFRALGFQTEKKFIESKFPVSEVDPDFFQRVQAVIRKRYGLRPLNPSSRSELLPRVDEMFELFNATYSRLPSFVPVSEAQKEYFKRKYLSIINPEYIKFIVDRDDRIISFAIVMPSFARALQKANGRLGPMGLYHLYRARKYSRDVLFYLIGISPEYQKKGVTSIIFNEYYRVFSRRRIQMGYRTPELEDNIDVQQIWKHFNPQVFKRRCTFRKAL